MIIKAEYLKNPYIGLFFVLTDEFLLMPPQGKKPDVELEAYQVTVFGSNVLGVHIFYYDGIFLIPPLFADEMEKLKNIAKEWGKDIVVFDDISMNAIPNNIIVGKNILVNPHMSRDSRKFLEDIFGKEVIPYSLQGYSTIGSIVVTNGRGFITHYKTAPNEMQFLENALGLSGITTTANMGTPFLRISVVCNNRMAIVGKNTTGIELTRISEGLGIEV